MLDWGGSHALPMEVGCLSAEPIAEEIVSGSTTSEPLYSTRRCSGARGHESRGTWYSIQGTGTTITASLCGYATYDTMVCSSFHSRGN